MSCRMCGRKETICLECTAGELWQSTLNCRCGMCQRKVRVFAGAAARLGLESVATSPSSAAA
jgi:hypothetical protein